MEDILTTAFQSGNATAILCAVVVYVIIHFQRKNTGDSRDAEYDRLKDEINELKKDSELKQKDIDVLKADTTEVKQDIKEMKTAIQSIQMSLEKITAYYDFLTNQAKK